MSGFEVTCVNRNSRGLLTRVGGDNWSMSIQEATMKILSHQVRLYIILEGTELDIGIRGKGSESYLSAEPDGIPLHTVIGLQSC